METRGKKILLVDDDPGLLECTSTVLRILGYNIKCLNNSPIILKVAKNYQPDLILMDFRMPQLNGLEATKLLKANSVLKSIPVIIFTAWVLNAETAFEAGASAILFKPFHIHELEMVINEHLRVCLKQI